MTIRSFPSWASCPGFLTVESVGVSSSSCTSIRTITSSICYGCLHVSQYRAAHLFSSSSAFRILKNLLNRFRGLGLWGSSPCLKLNPPFGFSQILVSCALEVSASFRCASCGSTRESSPVPVVKLDPPSGGRYRSTLAAVYSCKAHTELFSWCLADVDCQLPCRFCVLCVVVAVPPSVREPMKRLKTCRPY